MSDNEIKRQVWNGYIPIVFNMLSHEVTSIQSPHPLYVMIPRHSYLPLYIDQVKQHFEHYVSLPFAQNVVQQSSSTATTTAATAATTTTTTTTTTGGNSSMTPSSPSSSNSPLPLSSSTTSDPMNQNTSTNSSSSSSSNNTTTTTTTTGDNDNSSTSSSFLSSLHNMIWFSNESEETPLKWNLPVGVLYDAHVLSSVMMKMNEQDTDMSEDATNNDDMRILMTRGDNCPWRITVHFHSFPDQQIVRFKNESDIQWNYINSLKESFYIQYMDMKPIMTMSKPDQVKLWSSIKESQLSDYEQSLFSSSSSPSSNNNNSNNNNNNNNNNNSNSSNSAHQLSIRLIMLIHSRGNHSTTNNYHLEQKTTCVPSHNNNSSQEPLTLARYLDVQQERLSQFPTTSSYRLNKRRVMVQGVQPPMDTHMTWLSQHLSHPDQFLYVVVPVNCD